MKRERKNAIARWAVNLGGLVALCGVVITKSPDYMRRWTGGSYRYGDLYRFAKIKTFKPKNAIYSDEQVFRTKQLDSVPANTNGPEALRLLLFGDSFSFVYPGPTSFADELGAALNEPVYKVYYHEHQTYCRNPLLFFAEHSVTTNLQRVLIYEIVERSIIDRFAAPVPPPPYPKSADESSLVARFDQHLKENWFNKCEANSEVLFKESVVTFPVTELWNSILFDYLGILPQETRVYSACPPFLFYFEETDPALATSFYAPHKDSLITTLADHIADLETELRRRHAIRMVLVLVPNKFTLYSHMVTQDPYDQFLPRLETALTARGVSVLDLLPVFRSETNLLYYPSDTHWNELGMRIAAFETARYCGRGR
jgi:hypothetical protein